MLMVMQLKKKVFKKIEKVILTSHEQSCAVTNNKEIKPKA